MKFLSIDTSTPYSVVALCDERRLIYGQRRLFEKGRSDGLLSLIAHCLHKAKTKPEKIDSFAVGIGPGSFTGLRIGLSTVKALSYALAKPCYTFLSLDAIAFNPAPYKKERLCVVVDARRSNVYCRFYTLKNAGPARATEAMLVDIKTLEKNIESQSAGDLDMAFSGDGIPLCKEHLLKKTENVQFVPKEFWYPEPESIARLTAAQAKKNKPVDCFKVSAFYLYEQDCQVTRKCR